MRYGATPKDWDHFASALGLKVSLLPVVSNPNAEIDPESKMKGLGKTPSRYNGARKVVGIAGWTEHYATNGHVQLWAKEPDYGICVQTRQVGAIDIDVDDPDKAEALESAVIKALDGLILPARIRANSGKRLLVFRRDFPMTKRVIPVEGGIVEFLGDGQQFVAVGHHPSGVPYEWDCTTPLPSSIPALTPEELDAAWTELVLDFATGPYTIAREKRVPRGGASTYTQGDDPVADWLSENWETHDVGPDGQLFIQCPFERDHTTDSGPSSTAYFPAGTGGYQQGHFVCLHAHCAGREDRDFLDATGYNLAQFDDLGGGAHGHGSERSVSDGGVGSQADLRERPDDQGEPERPDRLLPTVVDSTRENPWPRMRRDPKGIIEAGPTNIIAAVQHGGMIGRHVAYDSFTDTLVWAPYTQPHAEASWQALGDADMTFIHAQLEQRGFKPIGRQLLRDGVHAAAVQNRIDIAQEWLARCEWDGVPRIERFAVDCWGWKESEYALAVGKYVWSAMAGRIIQPGVQADMAPILVGAQGLLKTSAIKAMVPHEDMYAEIKLDAKDADQSRQLRGKLIGELEELRGLNSRAIEEIKAFISRRRESWVPKFKEFESFFARRLLFVGSTNEDRFLADPTGERRFLPGRSHFININKLRETRNQLWAEGATLFRAEGVAWYDAERLAPAQHGQFKIGDPWERRLLDYIETEETDGLSPKSRGYVTVEELMTSALGLPVMHQNRTHAARIEKALQHLGYRRSARGWEQ